MPKKKVEEKTVGEQITDIFNQYLDTTSAIIDDYVPDPGMLVELSCADKNFQEEINALQEELETKETNFKYLLKKVKDHKDYDDAELWEIIEPGYAAEWLATKGYSVIKLENMQQQIKLEEFVTTKLYPNYNDRNNYNL
jgi:hypothetical protein